MTKKILDEYLKLEKEVHAYFGYVEDWFCQVKNGERTITYIDKEMKMYYDPQPIHGFTADEMKFMREVIDRSWDRIGGDMFYNDRGEYDESISYDRYAVAEIALDADRWRHEVGTKQDEFNLLVKKLYQLEEKEHKEVLDQVLPYSTYGA